ncbi:MAG: 2-oxo acid dehydrogenase subunit E2 [Clostridiales bacterium]|nr:2-oxo acid dehydrogenase subunit E2 [Clostridiales bacterium]
MEQNKKRKRRFGDRYDGRRLRTLDPMSKVSPYIMVTRNTSSNFFIDNVDIDEIERYIRHKRNNDGLVGFGIMHVIIAAYVRCVSQRPAINRFIGGQKVYARNGVQVNLTVKREMKSDGLETVIKIHPERDATASEIYELIKKEVDLSKDNAQSDFDGAAKALNYIPGLFLKFAVWALKTMDYFGILPKFLEKLSPFHGSMFITSMGSLGIPPIFHHLYDFGTVPVFCSFGAKQKRYELQADGTVKEKRYITLMWTLDERICDGFYYSTAMKTLKNILRNPFVLDERPEEVFEDIE